MNKKIKRLLREDEELLKMFYNDNIIYNCFKAYQDEDIEKVLIKTIKMLSKNNKSLFNSFLDCKMKCTKGLKS